MRYNPSNFDSRNMRTLIAGLLSYVLIAGQLTPLAVAASGPSYRLDLAKSSDVSKGNPAGHRSTAAAPIGLAPIAVPNIVATKVDSYPSSPGSALPGEVIT